MRQRSSNHSGIVIRRRVMPSGDLICTLLGPAGKFKAIARGGMKGPLASKLNLFHHVQVQLYHTPQADLGTIQQAVLEGALPTLAHLERHHLAHFMAELADLLFQEGEAQDAEQAFSYVAAALRGIAHQADPEWVALVMAFKLLGVAGLLPQVRQCTRCGAPAPAVADGMGGLLCGACAGKAYTAVQSALLAEALDFVQHIQQRTVSSHMQQPLTRAQRPAVWQLLERHLSTQLGGLKSLRQLL